MTDRASALGSASRQPLSQEARPTWRVFDLGGVLMNVDGASELSKLTGRRSGP